MMLYWLLIRAIAVFLALAKWLLINVGGLVYALWPHREEIEIPEEQRWELFADCGCRYFYTAPQGKQYMARIHAAPCDDEAYVLWDMVFPMRWMEFRQYVKDTGHAAR